MPPIFGRKITTGPEVLAFLEEIASAGLPGISCYGKTDGGGAQVMANISVQMFCRLTKNKYYHTPFSAIRFSQGDSQWNEKWENFFNLGHNEAQIPEGTATVSALDFLQKGRPNDVVLGLPHCHNYIHKNYGAEIYESIAEELREKYWSSGKDVFESRIEHKNYMAIHVRRGDVSDTVNASRFTSTDEVIRNVKLFQEQIGFDGEFHIFSQGDEKDFTEFKCLGNTKLFINTDVFEAMHRMVCAKAIFCARSTLSYTCALLSRAEVFSEAWYHRPLDSWYTPCDDGSIIQGSMTRQMGALSKQFQEFLKEDNHDALFELIEVMKGRQDLLLRSSKLQWFYALTLLRVGLEDMAYPILAALAASEKPQSKAAQKTLDAHQKSGRYCP